MMAAKFFQASNQSSEASENDGENEDDDDSLYLSAREDSDSFFSATGSRNNLRGTSKYTTILHVSIHVTGHHKVTDCIRM